MNTNRNVIAEFKDRFGDKRVIHKNRNGLAVKRQNLTVALRLNSVVGALIGSKVKKLRELRGYTLEQLAIRAGIVSTTPKVACGRLRTTCASRECDSEPFTRWRLRWM